MAIKSGVRSMEEIVSSLKAGINEATKPAVVKSLAEISIKIIVKRTRLGYGVDSFLGTKKKLNALSERYVERRRKSKLSPLTSPKKSNLTFTGQMLDSVKILETKQKGIIIGPSGQRSNSEQTNAEIMAYNEERGRVFLNLSDLEYAQVFREYRRTFGDLLKKRGLLK